MNVRGLWAELRDLPNSHTELDIYLEDGSKVLGTVVRNTPEKGPHVVLVTEPPEDAPEDEMGEYRPVQGVVGWTDNGDGTHTPIQGVVRFDNV